MPERATFLDAVTCSREGWGFLEIRLGRGRDYQRVVCGGDMDYIKVGRRNLQRDMLPQEPLNSKRMTKQQLIEKVAAKTELKKSEVEVVVDSVLAMITEALQANERVDLRGFGSFVVKERKERQGRNPRTGQTITIAAKRDAGFKPSKELTEKLAQVEAAPTPEVAP